MSGRLITAIASATAFQVKTTSTPARSSARPTRLSRPSTWSSRNPVATGGSTSGIASSVSATDLPRNDSRASA